MELSVRNPNSICRFGSYRSLFLFCPLLFFFSALQFCTPGDLLPGLGATQASAQETQTLPGDAAAQNAVNALTLLVENAKAGSASLDEIAHAFVENAVKGYPLPLSAAELSEQLPGIEEPFKPVITKAVETNLLEKKASSLAKLRELLPLLKLAAGDAESQFVAAELADSFLEAGDMPALQAHFSKVAAPLKKFVEPRVKSLQIIEQASKGNLSPEKSLELLSQLPACGKSTKTNQLALVLLKKVCEKITPEAEPILANTAVQQLAKSALGTNDAEKQVVAVAYDTLIRGMIERKSAENLLDSYRMLMDLRPDPNSSNVDLRMFAATHASTPDLVHFAVPRVEELRQAGLLGMGKKLRLIFSGYYGVFLPILVVIIILLFAGGSAAGVLIFVKMKREEYAVMAEEEDFQREKSAAMSTMKERARAAQSAPRKKDEKTGSTFGGKKPRNYVNPLRGEDEYSRLLTFFGLDDTATESDIKKAYRDKVKNFHPDSAGKDESTTEKDRTTFFIEAKETYDRILEIRGSWFGAKK